MWYFHYVSAVFNITCFMLYLLVAIGMVVSTATFVDFKQLSTEVNAFAKFVECIAETSSLFTCL